MSLSCIEDYSRRYHIRSLPLPSSCITSLHDFGRGNTSENPSLTGSASVMVVLCMRHVHPDSPLALAAGFQAVQVVHAWAVPVNSSYMILSGAIAGGCRILRESLREP